MHDESKECKERLPSEKVTNAIKSRITHNRFAVRSFIASYIEHTTFFYTASSMATPIDQTSTLKLITDNANSNCRVLVTRAGSCAGK